MSIRTGFIALNPKLTSVSAPPKYTKVFLWFFLSKPPKYTIKSFVLVPVWVTSTWSSVAAPFLYLKCNVVLPAVAGVAPKNEDKGNKQASPVVSTVASPK